MAQEYQDSGVPFLRSQNVRPHRIDIDDMKYIDDAFHAKLKKSQLRPGDVVTVRTGKPGQTSVVPDWLNSANCSDLVITRPGPNLDARWLSYYLNWVTDSHIAGHLVGAVQQHFNVKSAKGLELLLPSLVEQQAIAEILGALDSKIAANDHLAATALELARTVYIEILLGKPRISMSGVLNPILGGTPTRSDESLWNGSVAWASAKDVANAKHGVILSTLESITELAASKARTRTLPIGTVVLTARGTVGAVARLGVPASINQSCYGFVPSAIPTSCLFFTVEDAANQARSMAHGSVFDTITMSTFEHVRVPKLNDQEWLAIEERIAPILSSSQQAVSESRKLAATRDELLPLLMSGKVRVRDAEKGVEGTV
ncbi:restriction endonuclease subunit S [Amycolatopsis panacis]|nr:restriction endonuclease subunit S [Amycolatopsis panacis]